MGSNVATGTRTRLPTSCTPATGADWRRLAPAAAATFTRLAARVTAKRFSARNDGHFLEDGTLLRLIKQR